MAPTSNGVCDACQRIFNTRQVLNLFLGGHKTSISGQRALEPRKSFISRKFLFGANEDCSLCAAVASNFVTTSQAKTSQGVTFVFDLHHDEGRQSWLRISPQDRDNRTISNDSALCFLVDVRHETTNCLNDWTNTLETNLRAQRNLCVAADWLKDCNAHHEDCKIVSGGVPPLRLIRIPFANETALPRLVEGVDAGENCIYAALSYCWGPTSREAATTLKTLASRQTELHTRNLPRTIQDAIEVSLALGIQYLWVDALCIVQDDDEEKAREIDEMHRIYGQASLTISAANSSDAMHGFLRKDSASLHEQTAIAVPLACSACSRCTLEMYSAGSQEMSEPLTERAWALQEHFLSRRILVFGKFHMSWACNTNKSPKKGGISSPVIAPTGATHASIAVLRKRWPFYPYPGIVNEKSFLVESWRDVVTEFSSRKLTHGSDRLPALAGIARHYQSEIGDHYLAGLWQKTLLQDLAWTVEPLQPNLDDRMAETWCALSWSWLSVRGTLKYNVKLSEDLRDLVEICSCHIQPRFQFSPFREVSSAVLKFQGRLARALIRYQTLTSTGQSHRLISLDDRKSRYTAVAVLDPRVGTAGELRLIGNELPDHFEDHVWCLPLTMRLDEVWERAITGLILRRQKDNTYVRIGLFYDDIPGDYESFSRIPAWLQNPPFREVHIT